MTFATAKHASKNWPASTIHSLNQRFREKAPRDILSWATTEFASNIVLTCSFGGVSGMVLLDMVVRLDRRTPILFLDTNLLFPETYALAERAARHYGIEIAFHQPALTLHEQERDFGPQLYQHDPDRCCSIRKVAPLAKALQPFDAWISGIRRDQSSTRAATEVVEWNTKHNLLKISPLAWWGERDVWRYIHANGVPYNPLLDQGYSSLGCAPCTVAASGENSRAGRWAGTGKVECGIHL